MEVIRCLECRWWITTIALGLVAVLNAGCTDTSALPEAGAQEAAAPTVSFETKVDFLKPEWNRDTWARLDADLDPTKEKVGWLKGKVFGVRPNEPVRELFIMEGFSVVRTKKLEDGSIRRLLREVVFYRDVESGQILETWDNPYTGETVRVVPIANDPYNFTISAYRKQRKGFQAEGRDQSNVGEPFLLDWEDGPNGTIILNTGINLFYPNQLSPEKWVRESGGAFNRVSEQFLYVFKRSDAEDPTKTHIPAVGSWSRITPWLPWMLMGQAEGHISYFSHFTTLPGGIADLPEDVQEAARAIDPKFLSAPLEDYGPSVSSLEVYSMEQEPAPVPEGWEPPRPPPPSPAPSKQP
ncbi:MAG: DUF1838 family protein [Lysobacterales bacterium]